MYDVITKKREETRDRVRKHREKTKRQKQGAIEMSSDRQETNLSEIVSASYSNIQTLGKAVKKVHDWSFGNKIRFENRLELFCHIARQRLC